MARYTPQWDADSAVVGIDNRCTVCISHEAQYFIVELKDSNRAIKGFGGTKQCNVRKGTIKWHWEDINGKIHKFVIPNS